MKRDRRFETVYRLSLFILLCFFVMTGLGQSPGVTHEQVIFSFFTLKGKKVSISKDPANRYLIYRYESNGKVAFEYPDQTKESWSKFTYSFYLRGGGKANEGMDLNYLYFTHQGYQYIVYDTYYAVGDKVAVGVKVRDLKSGKITDIKGYRKTRVGSFLEFRTNGLLEIGDELFE